MKTVFEQITITLAGNLDTPQPVELALNDDITEIESMSFSCVDMYPAPASIQVFELEGDSSMFAKGLLIANFIATDKPYSIDLAYKVGSSKKIKLQLKDEANGGTPYKVQLSFKLIKK